MNWATSYLFDMELLEFELECALDKKIVAPVISAMEEDGGMNWQKLTNAVFSVECMLHDIHKRIEQRTEQAGEEWSEGI